MKKKKTAEQSKSRTVSVRIPMWIFEHLENIAQVRDWTVSHCIAVAAKEYVANHER